VKGGVAIVAAVAAVLYGCSDPRGDTFGALDALPGPAVPTTTTSAPPPSARVTECQDRDQETFSLRPDEAATARAVAELRERGRLVVGVDVNTRGFASRNPDNGEPEGFEVELAKEIATRLLGPDAVVVFKPVVTETKLTRVEDGTLDMSISANSMSCGRLDQVSFSTEYYTARQAFLVPKDRRLTDLSEARICVTGGSSSARILKDDTPDVTLVTRKTRPECLVAIQEGAADAYFGHDSFLFGLQQVDPNTDIQYGLLRDDRNVTASHYGIAISNERPDLLRAVNGALEDIRADGTWQELYQELREELPGIPPKSPPAPEYLD
jgi:polar amino acid transport system substrate-binding protein